jgi:hypothetical protein
MENTKIRVIYFDARGRAELIRQALTIGEIPFDDVRLTGDEFAK